MNDIYITYIYIYSYILYIDITYMYYYISIHIIILSYKSLYHYIIIYYLVYADGLQSYYSPPPGSHPVPRSPRSVEALGFGNDGQIAGQRPGPLITSDK